jgi:hypothetical protein
MLHGSYRLNNDFYFTNYFVEYTDEFTAVFNISRSLRRISVGAMRVAGLMISRTHIFDAGLKIGKNARHNYLFGAISAKKKKNCENEPVLCLSANPHVTTPGFVKYFCEI